MQKFSLTILTLKFRESNVFTKEVTKVDLTKFFSVRENFSFFHSVYCALHWLLSHVYCKKSREIKSFSKEIAKQSI